MSLREEFEESVKTNGDLELFFSTSNTHYIHWLENKIKQSLDTPDGEFWDKFANTLKDELGESLVEENGNEEDPYNWWLVDVTVLDIVDYMRNYFRYYPKAVHTNSTK